MSRWRNRYWGQMYLVPLDWNAEGEDADDSVVHSFEYGRSHFKVASELWALADALEPAKAIEEVFSMAYQREPHLLERPDIEGLLRLLDGLQERLLETVVDKNGQIPSERVPEVKRRTTMLEIDEPNHPEGAVAAGMSRVAIARDILEKALQENLNIVLD